MKMFEIRKRYFIFIFNFFAFQIEVNLRKNQIAKLANQNIGNSNYLNQMNRLIRIQMSFLTKTIWKRNH